MADRAGFLKHLCAAPGIAPHVERRRIALHDLPALAWVVLEQRAGRRSDRVVDVHDEPTFLVEVEVPGLDGASLERIDEHPAPGVVSEQRVGRLGAHGRREVRPTIDQKRTDRLPRSPSERAHGRDLHGLGLMRVHQRREERRPIRGGIEREQPDRIGALAFIGRPGARGRLRARERFPRGGVLAHAGNRKQVQGAGAHRG